MELKVCRWGCWRDFEHPRGAGALSAASSQVGEGGLTPFSSMRTLRLRVRADFWSALLGLARGSRPAG